MARNTTPLLSALEHFSSQEVIRTNPACLWDFSSGATFGWGTARNRVQTLLTQHREDTTDPLALLSGLQALVAEREVPAEVDEIDPGGAFYAGASHGWNEARARVGKILGTACHIFLDGDAWCCVRGDFVNLQESPAGFGATRDQAAEALISEALNGGRCEPAPAPRAPSGDSARQEAP